jgi:hypothetical protein
VSLASKTRLKEFIGMESVFNCFIKISISYAFCLSLYCCGSKTNTNKEEKGLGKVRLETDSLGFVEVFCYPRKENSLTCLPRGLLQFNYTTSSFKVKTNSCYLSRLKKDSVYYKFYVRIVGKNELTNLLSLCDFTMAKKLNLAAIDFKMVFIIHNSQRTDTFGFDSNRYLIYKNRYREPEQNDSLIHSLVKYLPLELKQNWLEKYWTELSPDSIKIICP